MIDAGPWDVVGCRACSCLWLLGQSNRLGNEQAVCPNCGITHQTANLRPLAQHETKTGAAELRSRILADRAGQLAEYEADLDYSEMADEVEDQLERFTLTDQMDLTPIGSDIGADRAEKAFGHTDDWFADAAEKRIHRATYDDSQLDLTPISSDIGADAVAERLEAWQQECESGIVDVRTGELALDQQRPVDAAADLTLDETTAVSRSESSPGLWARLLEAPRIQEAFVAGVRAFATGRTTDELTAALEAWDVPLELQGLIERVARGIRGGATREMTTRRILYGAGDTPGLLYLARRLGTQRGGTDAIFATTRFIGFGAAQTDADPPTIAVRLEDAFWEHNRPRRDDVVTFLWHLARHCEIVVTASPVRLRRFVHTHSLDHDAFHERLTGPHTDGQLDERVDRALDTIEADSTGGAILKHLADDIYETLSYADISEALDVSKATISNWVVRRDNALTTLGLVTTFEDGNQTRIELEPAGRRVVEYYSDKTTTQQPLDAFQPDNQTDPLTNPLQPSGHGRVTTGEGPTPSGDDPRRKGDGLAPVQELSRSDAYGAIAAAPDNGLATVDYPIEKADDYRQPSLWTEPTRVVVSAEYVNPMQYWVSIARALTHPRLFARTLTTDRLTSTDHEFSQLFNSNKELLRGSRCLGYLTDALDDPADYPSALQDARDALEELTTDLHNGDFEDETRLRQDITRNALGLASTVVHLLDLIDVDVTREFRLPTFSSDFDADRWEPLIETVAISSAIQSRYGHYAAYRQLFEQREEKLQAALEPTVDAADPLGTLIGSTVLVGNFGDPHEDESKAQQFTADLRAALGMDSQRDNGIGAALSPREDAPEFNIEIPVRCFTQDRAAVATATALMGGEKNLRPSRPTVSALRLFTATAYDVTAALHWLSAESSPRELRVDEVRTALSRLDADRLVPTLRPAAGAIVKALLWAEGPVSTSELAQAAGVARSTLSRNGSAPGDRLQALGLVAKDGDGWQVLLSDDASERHDPVMPAVLADDSVEFPQEELRNIAERAAALGNQSLLREWPTTVTSEGILEFEVLLQRIRWLRPWVEHLEAILETSEEAVRQQPASGMASLGPVIQQMPLPDGEGAM